MVWISGTKCLGNSHMSMLSMDGRHMCGFLYVYMACTCAVKAAFPRTRSGCTLSGSTRTAGRLQAPGCRLGSKTPQISARSHSWGVQLSPTAGTKYGGLASSMQDWSLWTQQNWLAGGLTIEAQVRPGYGTSVHAQVMFHGLGAPAACANIRACFRCRSCYRPVIASNGFGQHFESDSARGMSGVFTRLQQCGPPHNSRRRQPANTFQHTAPCRSGRQIHEAWFYHPHPRSRNRNSHRLLRARHVCTVSGQWWTTRQVLNPVFIMAGGFRR